MDIWKILHIEATTDKRAIKKAYALRSKTVHPEEKPEEFSQLYEAYKIALQYAKHGDGIVEVEIAEPVLEEPEALSELTIFFSEQQKYREVCLEDFQKALERMYETQGLYGEAQVWQSYLKSKEFKEIQMDPQVIRQMTKAVQNMGFHVLEFSLNLWEIYDLQDDETYQYNSALRELCRSLAPARLSQRAGLEQVKKFEKEELKKKRYFQTILVILAIVLVTGVSIVVYQKVFMSRTNLIQYMAREYPETEFSKPKRQNSSDEDWDVFSFHTLDQPEIAVCAQVEKEVYSGIVIEDYGAQRIRKIEEIVEPYGLSFYLTKLQDRENGLCVFNYSGIGEIEEFCRLFDRFYEEEKNNIRQYIGWVGFCPEGILYPQIMMGGEVTGELWNTPIYQLGDLPGQEELLISLQNLWVQYMYFYEAWNLTPEQEEKYGPGYLELARRGEKAVDENPGLYGAVDDVRATETAHGLYLPLEMSQSQDNRLFKDYYITIGNAYQYLKAKGAEIEIYPDGSGFRVYSAGSWFQFGEDVKVSLNRIFMWVRLN